MRTVILLLLALGIPPQAGAESFLELIQLAERGGPASLSQEATIYYRDPDGVVLRVREGTNGWWCMPPSLAPEGPRAPLCGDMLSFDWVMAWLNREPPIPGLPGVIYALAGGRDASAVDPFAPAPLGNRPWIVTGPCLMIVNAPDMMAAYPASTMPDTSLPYAMWAETPYAHVRLPLD